jgi:hypothetical protein
MSGFGPVSSRLMDLDPGRQILLVQLHIKLEGAVDRLDDR